ncbi:MAG: DUF4111 domain-containing protein [Chloroflexi bacterium]|nr:DUF4111 domain-containing protein [Chloroflexota bacterium]OJV94795.1 MAG: hypothetical protein BGO39_34020 [Chloroflexi bacterium 54-19]
MTATLPEVVRPLLDEYLALLEEKLPGLVGGFYLQGSLALDAFNARLSDIDFVAFLNRGWTTRDLTELQNIHDTLHQKYRRWPVEGLFLEWPGQADPAKVVLPYLNQHMGKITLESTFELNDVTWWLLKEKGIALKGPEAHSLGYSVDWQALLAGMYRNQNTYWASYTRKPGRMAQLLTGWGIEWAVLGSLRQLYTFRENDITSKSGAGRYALKNLPAKWHPLVQEALNLREQPDAPSLYTSKVFRAFQAVRFLRYVRKECNRFS